MSNSNITNTGSVVIQTTHDINTIKNRLRQQCRKGNNGCISYADVIQNPGAVMTEDASIGRIDPGELVYRFGSSSAPRGNILDGAPPVLSALNGLFVPDDTLADTKEKKMRKLLEPICYIGVAVNGTDPMNNDMALRRSQCSVRVLGTVTVQNTTGKNIAPGDLLCYNIPTSNHRFNGFTPVTARDGINHNKICLVLEKFDPSSKRWEYLKAYSHMQAANEFSRYIVGTALNYSKPNGKLDLKLKN